ncbi:tetratricopeptide repeat protein [Pelagicoccus sp. SDUM812005]|uniref:tetratricopeptide repeat protein n=1 Tax=Pelagicoccus sp. SDUM812005 TaxID=3041257 RepID=UPI0028101087|nr:tetratricopeptide repeat protein [Pelagicoccus sp. SDUM812005]MDQ8182708.1 tetratricopeptide repeat protein [Pelagicoccus sp. SDUM812005]
MKKLIPILLALAGLATAFLLWQKSSKTAALVSEATPPIPASIENQELLTRIQKATTQAQEGPTPIEGLATLSRLYHANGFTREAWQCYAALVLAEPDQARWPYLFARILAGYGQLEEASPLFARASELAPDYTPARIRLGDTLLKQNKFEEAQSAYQKTLSQDPANAYALVGLARVAIARDDYPLARTHLEKAVQTTNYQIGADLLGDVYKKLNLPHLENRVLQNTAWGSYADIPDPWSLSLMDDCYDAYQVSIAGGWVAHQGDLRKGLRYMRRAVELDPDNATLQYQIGGAYLALDDLERAEEHYRRCVELQPDYADAWLALIDIAQRRQSPTLTRRTLEAALRAAPNSPSLNIEKGKALLALKRFNQALPYFEKSIELRPHEAVGYIELARAYLAQERIEEGIAQMREALLREPNNPIALTTMVFDAILRADQPAADKWLAQVRQQARIRPDEVAALESRYQKQFGQAPPR